MKLCEICGEQKRDDDCMTACAECRTEVHDDHVQAEDEVRRLRAELSTVLAERDGLQSMLTQQGRELAALRSEATVERVLTAIAEAVEGMLWGEARARVRAALGMPEVKP